MSPLPESDVNPHLYVNAFFIELKKRGVDELEFDLVTRNRAFYDAIQELELGSNKFGVIKRDNPYVSALETAMFYLQLCKMISYVSNSNILSIHNLDELENTTFSEVSPAQREHLVEVAGYICDKF